MPSLEAEVVEDDSSSDSDDSDDENNEKIKMKNPTKNMSEKMKVEGHFYDIK